MNASEFMKRNLQGISISRLTSLAHDQIEAAKAIGAQDIKEVAEMSLKTRLTGLGATATDAIIEYAVECAMSGKELPLDGVPAGEA
ncbi:hypothetical protein [Sulfuricurvum sp.]|uniref:hypothetical protein n=1 Tax=Sulfuricurvum sp. TaxID=2025608 RepID=UPI003562F856